MKPREFGFTVSYVRQMPRDVPEVTEQILIFGTWWIRTLARDVIFTLKLSTLAALFFNIQQFLWSEPTVSLAAMVQSIPTVVFLAVMSSSLMLMFRRGWPLKYKVHVYRVGSTVT